MREHLVSHKMAEGGFDDMEMTERDPELRKYSDSKLQNEYDELSENRDTLIDEFQGADMTDVVRVHDIEDRMTLLRSEMDRRREEEESVKIIQESSFTDDADGKIVTITRDGTSLKAPGVVPPAPGIHDVATFKRQSTEDKKTFMRRIFGSEIRAGDGPKSKELLRLTTIDPKDNSAKFDGKRIFVRKGRGIGLTENKKMKSKVDEFFKLLQDAESERGLPMVNITSSGSAGSSGTPIHGLTEQENGELSGVLNPGPSTLCSTRIGDDGALQIQVDHFKKSLEDAREAINGYRKSINEVVDATSKSRKRFAKRVAITKQVLQEREREVGSQQESESRERAVGLEEEDDEIGSQQESELREGVAGLE